MSVFGPIVYVEGVAGELFGDLSLAVTFSLMASLLVALTLLPAFAARFTGGRRPDDGLPDDPGPGVPTEPRGARPRPIRLGDTQVDPLRRRPGAGPPAVLVERTDGVAPAVHVPRLPGSSMLGSDASRTGTIARSRGRWIEGAS